ncbi:protein kinase kinase kinase [Perkinsus chesapeaki]|uniref:Protein kinase kinase kinase n=1 Tax=Perkinsus chesapeaki TaxID=330153 RepID=A0A7J6MSR3_PERCH|nr:protein kinase kinase kinase [Perkinsus chesapeaki]
MPLADAFKSSLPNQQDYPLFAAVKDGSLDEVRKALDADRSRVTRATDRDGKTILHIAASLGRDELIPLIYQYGIDVNEKDKDGWTPLHHAAFVNQIDAIQALLKIGGDVHKQNKHGRTPVVRGRFGTREAEKHIALLRSQEGVHISAEWENLEVLEILLEAGGPNAMTIADELGRTPMEYATPETRKSLMKYMVKFSNQPNPGGGQAAQAPQVATQGNIDLAKMLLKAAQSGSIESASNLIDPADKSQPKLDINASVDKDGWTALHHATFMNHLDMVRYLLDKGADPAKPNKFGRTVIHVAAEWENEEPMRLILEYVGKKAGALVLQPDNSGRLAVEYAANENIKTMLKEKTKEVAAGEAAKDTPAAPAAPAASSADLKSSDEWQSWEVDPATLVMEEKVGSGITADVYRGSWRGTDVAIKKINWDPRAFESTEAAFHRELMIMAKCRHPNLVLFMGAATKTAPLMMVCEFCEGGTIFDLAHNKRDVDISWRQRMKMLLDIAKGMNYLHTCDPPIVRELIHRDLKSLNLLLVERVEDEFDTPIVKVADFGLSKLKASATQNMTANAGTYHWMAPEVLNGEKYDEKVDSYSYAIVMYEILCRLIPFEDTGLQPLQIAMAVSKGQRPDTSRAPRGCPAPLIALMERCWTAKPADR